MNYFLSIKFIKLLVPSALIFVVLDYLWLALIAKNFYFERLSYLAKVEKGSIVFNLPVGLAVQLIIGAGLAFFICLALLTDNSLKVSIVTGIISGFIIYAAYDMTSHSFIKDWPLSVTIIDMLWGMTQGLFAGIYVYFLRNIM